MLGSVKESINILLKGPIDYEFRFTVVPCYHSPDDIYTVARELSGASQLRLQNFNPVHTLDPLLNTSHVYRYEELIAYQQKVDQILSHKADSVSNFKSPFRNFDNLIL